MELKKAPYQIGGLVSTAIVVIPFGHNIVTFGGYVQAVFFMPNSSAISFRATFIFYSFTWFDLKKVKNHLFYLILFLIISTYTSSISIIIPVLFAFCFSFIIFIASAVVPLPPKGSIISASFGKIPIILHITSNGI